jgi:hypothetical protein
MGNRETRYIGISTVGSPPRVLEKIRQAVQQFNLMRRIPIIKIERKPKRQFYVFLAIQEATDDRLSDDVLQFLRAAGLTGSPYLVNGSEIETMTGKAEIEIHLLNKLKYRALWSSESAGDPFDLSDMSPIEASIDDPEMSQRYNKLLYWLSATAEGRWETFARACKVLQLADDSQKARHIFRRFILLGHIECSSNGADWMVCPAALVQTPTKIDQGYLCGQRTPRFLGKIRERWTIEETHQPNNQCPQRMEVGCRNTRESYDEPLALEMAGIASVKLTEILPGLEAWKAMLTRIDKFITAHYVVERWDGDQYIPYTFVEGAAESGLYRLTRGEGKAAYRLVLYFDQEHQRWLKGDWYGLRFLTLHSTNVNFEAIHNQQTNELFIQAEQRWPLIYERALVLASGLLPTKADNPKWLRYQDIPKELAQSLANKLGVHLEEKVHA